MPRYFFDIHYGSDLTPDTEGTVCENPSAVRREAMRALPAIAADKIYKDGDRQAYTVLVRNDSNITVYTATLTFAGLWIGEDIPPRDDPDA